MAAANEEILETLRPALIRRFTCSSIKLTGRRFYEYYSSFAIEELLLDCGGGRSLAILFKDMGDHGLLDEARRTRPAADYDSSREILVYTEILSKLRLGTAEPYAAQLVPERHRYWLFLEKVPGRELYQVGEFPLWEETARWLARFHDAVLREPFDLGALSLLRWNSERYELLLQRARISLLARPGQNSDVSRLLDRVEASLSQIVELLIESPQGLTHGEFYASNVLVQEAASNVRVCPIDWETAGIGPLVLDVAALVAGRWEEQPRQALINAYWSELTDSHRQLYQSETKFQAAVVCARLVLALQILGRSPDWTPPADHRQDWIREIEQLLASIGQDS